MQRERKEEDRVERDRKRSEEILKSTGIIWIVK